MKSGTHLWLWLSWCTLRHVAAWKRTVQWRADRKWTQWSKTRTDSTNARSEMRSENSGHSTRQNGPVKCWSSWLDKSFGFPRTPLLKVSPPFRDAKGCEVIGLLCQNIWFLVVCWKLSSAKNWVQWLTSEINCFGNTIGVHHTGTHIANWKEAQIQNPTLGEVWGGKTFVTVSPGVFAITFWAPRFKAVCDILPSTFHCWTQPQLTGAWTPSPDQEFLLTVAQWMAY